MLRRIDGPSKFSLVSQERDKVVRPRSAAVLQNHAKDVVDRRLSHGDAPCRPMKNAYMIGNVRKLSQHDTTMTAGFPLTDPN